MVHRRERYSRNQAAREKWIVCPVPRAIVLLPQIAEENDLSTGRAGETERQKRGENKAVSLIVNL